ncbi:MAG TPA: hypothetical protein VFI39_02045 [Gemmatimonadales bacterium]|nr:hypothetical protein [Gemmatimonadales bacterium]
MTLSLTRWSSLVRAPLSGVLAVVLAFSSPAMVLRHAVQSAEAMPGMPGHAGGERHAPTRPGQAPLQPCCDLCVVACVAATSGAPHLVVAFAVPAVRSAQWIPAAAWPSGKLPAPFLPPSIGPPAQS